MGFEVSKRIYEESLKLIPWGVQTGSKRPEFLFFGDGPIYVAKAKGSKLWDVDGNEYIDYIMALGAVFLGYNRDEWLKFITEQMERFVLTSLSSVLEYELASEIAGFIPSVEMIRFFKTGAEATSSAVRVARAFTGREKILACGYFGWHDWANTGYGIPDEVKKLTIWFKWDEIDRVEGLLENDEFAGVIVEPVMGDEPTREKLEFLRDVTKRTGTLLIFDEIKTGFRFPSGSAQSYFGVIPDLTVLGKSLANGMPLSALGGKRDVMKEMEKLWISTTYGSEALSLASSLFTVREIKRAGIEKTWNLGEMMMSEISRILCSYGMDKNAKVVGYPTMFWVKFEDEDMERKFIRAVMRRGILLKRGGYNFLSMAHDRNDVDRTLDVVDEVLRRIGRGDDV
ncbi:MAG TPA: aminotransferase class III-fold pyridoxal phosphate-dependent enzyme [Thermotogales bacterium]|nr:aminotransferase class III-fold pyridoxal phosphate-dependent enzyme [Thermotogales bacterium]